MNKLIIIFFAIIIVGVGGGKVGAEALPDFDENARVEGMPSAVISEIEVPYEVHMFVQLEHQGHAVVRAREVTRGTDRVYELLASRDDVVAAGEGIYVIFDKEWRLITEEERQVPAPRQPAAPSPPEEEPEEEPEETSEVSERAVPPRGREGGADDDNDDEPGRGNGENGEDDEPDNDDTDGDD